MVENQTTSCHPVSRRRNDQGFTLMEIAIAILILAGSLVTLLGLQSAVISRTIHDRDSQRAMLAARRIMASLEASEQPPKDRNSESSLADLLTEFVTVPNPELLQQNLEGFSAELDVRDQPIDLFPEAHVKRLTLTIKWSEDNRDQISILYFFPAQDSAAGNDGAAVDEGEADQEDG